MTQPSLGWHRVLDWRPTSVPARIGIVLLLLAPIAIAGTMMWAMWDPSKYMRDIELAVVNEDTGVTSRGEYTNYGDQIVEGLLNTDYLNFTQVDKEKAEEGLTRGKYMMVVSIPEVFSEQAVTIISDNPVRPEIEFATNDYYGTNSSVITSSLVPKVQTSVENAITKKYADKVIAGFGKLSDGLDKAAEGATKLDEGAGKLQEGGGKAVDGIAKLDDGATKLNAGMAELQAGTGKLNNGATQLSGGMDSLVAGTGTLADGAGQIEAGVVQLTDKLIPVLNQAQAVAPQLAQAEQALRAAGMIEQANKVGDLAHKLNPDNSENMVAQLNKLRDGTALLHQNLADPNSQYLGGMLKLQDGAHRLASGASQLETGADKLATGTAQLKDGTGKLRDGGGQLKDGLDKLKDGTGELSTKLTEGAAKAPKITKPDVSAQNMAVPINFTSVNQHPVQTILSADDPTDKEITGGVSMLLIMVFGFLLMLLVALLLPYYFGRSSRSATAVLSAWGIKTAANLLALGLLALVSRAMGWEPLSWGAVIPVLVLTAACGAASYQLFQVLFGRGAGGGFGLAFFTLGLMVFGGVWPVVAIPSFLRLFHFIHPMTYAKTAFIRATDGIHDTSLFSSLGVLLAFTLISLAISVGVLHARRTGQAAPLAGQEHPGGLTGAGTAAPASTL